MMEKQKKLIALLLKKTQRGELDWSEAIGKEAFQVSFKENSVRIRATPNQSSPEESDYEVALLNDEGRIVDSFTDIDLGNTENESAAKQRIFAATRDLYDLARRTALGSEKVLNEILSEIEEDEIPF
jgi:hypothetical protein